MTFINHFYNKITTWDILLLANKYTVYKRLLYIIAYYLVFILYSVYAHSFLYNVYIYTYNYIYITHCMTSLYILIMILNIRNMVQYCTLPFFFNGKPNSQLSISTDLLGKQTCRSVLYIPWYCYLYTYSHLLLKVHYIVLNTHTHTHTHTAKKKITHISM